MWGIASVPTMKPSPSYLTRNRHGTFYFRIVIPRPVSYTHLDVYKRQVHTLRQVVCVKG